MVLKRTTNQSAVNWIVCDSRFSHRGEPGQSEKAHTHCYCPQGSSRMCLYTLYGHGGCLVTSAVALKGLCIILWNFIFIFNKTNDLKHSEALASKSQIFYFFFFSCAVIGYYGVLFRKIHLQFEEHLEILVAPNCITWRREGWRQLKCLAAAQAVLKTSASLPLLLQVPAGISYCWLSVFPTDFRHSLQALSEHAANLCPLKHVSRHITIIDGF